MTPPAPSLRSLVVLVALLVLPPTLTAQEWSFVRGDGNGDGLVDVADAVTSLDYLFISGSVPPPCLDALDLDDDGVLDLADPILVIGYLFSGGLPPEAPFPDCGPDETADGITCLGPLASCPPFEPPIATFLYADEAEEDGAGVFLVPQPAPADAAEFLGRRLGMRPLDVDLPLSQAGSDVLIETTVAGLSFYLADGTALVPPFTLTAADLPVTLLVNADVPVETTIVATSVLSGASDTLFVRGGPFPGLAGKTLGQFPHFQCVDTFDRDGPAVEIAVDPARFSDRVGLPFSVYVVPHKTLDEWAADPTLDDVTTAVEAVSLLGTTVLDMIIPVWVAGLDAGTLVSLAYDVVLDFDGNGLLDPGDIVEGLGDEPAFSVVRPLLETGPYAVTEITYSGGTFLGQDTYYPTDIATLGELPLVVISHGNGHQYTWYDYLGFHLASYGYVVMSHQNNTMPGIETAATTTLSNTEYFLGNYTTLAGGVLAGHVDVDRIAWVGHSRGGEGVTRAYDRIADGLYTPNNFDAEDIRVISSIAPTVFLGPLNANAHDRNYHLIAGGADGDVTGGADCPICQFFRLQQQVTGAIQVTYVHGADHNDFNCCGFNDGQGPAQIGRPAAQNIAKAYYLALVEHYLKDNPGTLDYFRRNPGDLLPDASLSPYTIASQYQPRQSPDQLVIDTFQEFPSDTGASDGGWPVTFDVENVHEDRLRELNGSFSWTPSDPRNGMTQCGTVTGDVEQGVVFDWPNDGSSRFYQWEVPLGEGNWLEWAFLTLRVCQGTRHPFTNSLNGLLDFTVTLEDTDGNTASILSTPYSQITKPYPRTGLGSGAGWANEFNTVRLRLADFRSDGTTLRLDDIRYLRLEFGTGNGSPLGRIGIDDVLLVR